MSTKRINVDAIAALDAALEITVGGKTYTVDRLNEELAERVNEIQDAADPNESLHSVLARQCAALFSVDASEFRGLDMRKLAAARDAVLREILEAGEHLPRRQRRGK